MGTSAVRKAAATRKRRAATEKTATKRDVGGGQKGSDHAQKPTFRQEAGCGERHTIRRPDDLL